MDITLTEEVLVATSDDTSSTMNYVVYGSVFAAIILSIVLLIAFINNESEKKRDTQSTRISMRSLKQKSWIKTQIKVVSGSTFKRA